MADFKYNPDTDEYEYVGNGYEGNPEAQWLQMSGTVCLKRGLSRSGSRLKTMR